MAVYTILMCIDLFHNFLLSQLSDANSSFQFNLNILDSRSIPFSMFMLFERAEKNDLSFESQEILFDVK